MVGQQQCILCKTTLKNVWNSPCLPQAKYVIIHCKTILKSIGKNLITELFKVLILSISFLALWKYAAYNSKFKQPEMWYGIRPSSWQSVVQRSHGNNAEGWSIFKIMTSKDKFRFFLKFSRKFWRTDQENIS